LHAGDAQSPSVTAALEQLCQSYWNPLYAYVRRQGHGPEDAQDLTQAFFGRFLEKDYVRRADPDRGRFRTFLLSALKNFLTNEWARGQAAKRGGGQTLLSVDATTAEGRYSSEPVDHVTPENLYEQRWAAALLAQVLARLREELSAAGKQELFDALKGFISDETSLKSYREVAIPLGMTEGAVRVTAHRLRERYRELLRLEVANTVAGPNEVDEELRHLTAVLQG